MPADIKPTDVASFKVKKLTFKDPKAAPPPSFEVAAPSGTQKRDDAVKREV